MRGESAILHAETGSGKTLAYLLTFTEHLWSNGEGFGVVMTPTRELAAQVAGIATVLSPPGTVRLVSQATNLMSDGIKERGEGEYGWRLGDESRNSPQLFIGSAKAIMQSLYGDGVMPASPTTKPEAQYFIKNVKYLVLDEVDRLLQVKKSRSESKKHEKPAAIVTAAVTRMTLGRAQIVAASATVGRPLKRELARVLGLPAQSCPRVIRGDESNESEASSSRAVTVPPTVNNYVVAVDGSSTGKLLTSAYFVIKQLFNKPRKMLLVLTRACNMSTKHAVGALSHFQCKPEPISLLDALEATGTNDMISIHRQVSGASGVGESNSYFATKKQESDNQNDEAYLLVTGEDTVRGLHLDGLDVVIVVGRPHGPDEYTHIAGRTGRAGLTGSVINVVSDENAAALSSWEHMLSLSFSKLEVDDISNL
jgi:superfamily II DNA/RNA helicase